MSRILLAIDPGLMTGVTVCDISDMDNPIHLQGMELTLDEFYDKIEDLVKKSDQIVIENFFINEESLKKDFQPYSMWLIGVVNMFAYRHGKIPVDTQEPYEKDFMTNDFLRNIEFWYVGGKGHANDSARHAAVWILNKNKKYIKTVYKGKNESRN